ncbi:MAG TPA: SH3 domain-containing protein [Chloroflexota bacterium]|jgi:hypothetical protein
MRQGLSRWDRPTGDDSHMGLVMLLALLGGLIFGGFVFWQMSRGHASAPGIEILGARTEARPPVRALSGAINPPQAAAAGEAPNALAQPTSPPQPTPTVNPDAAHVAHTDGVGVVLRASPRDNDWTPRGFLDGDAVTIVERQGKDWARIRGPNGQEGWVPTKYLER